MDQRLSKALEFANYRQTLYLEQQRLKEKLKSSLTLSFNGGRFIVDRTLISFLNSVTPEENTNSMVILDEYLNPIYIEDLSKFRREVISLYCTLANQHYQDMEKLKKKRTPSSIVGL